ncbi:MAG: lytic transglycosylase domain-containing protein [Rhodobacteraceae bacterium]|nr:lytic transglycosylase domain-containing protein [Paracoccaceae bacterium]
MTQMTRRTALGLCLATLAACGARPPKSEAHYAGNTPQMQRLVARYAAAYDIPESLIHRVIRRESSYNPRARHRNYYGLMQIDPRTARAMGYKGPAEGLLDAETNLKYAGKYLRGAWLVARGNQDRAVMWYAKGYYYQAKKMGLLEEVGLRS